MRWFRSHSRWGASLALFALASHLVLSFGHVHRKDIAGASHSPAVIDVSTVAQAHEPVDRESDEHEDQHCLIYAIVNLLGCSQTAEPPDLPFPLRVSLVRDAAR